MKYHLLFLVTAMLLVHTNEAIAFGSHKGLTKPLVGHKKQLTQHVVRNQYVFYDSKGSNVMQAFLRKYKEWEGVICKVVFGLNMISQLAAYFASPLSPMLSSKLKLVGRALYASYLIASHCILEKIRAMIERKSDQNFLPNDPKNTFAASELLQKNLGYDIFAIMGARKETRLTHSRRVIEYDMDELRQLFNGNLIEMLSTIYFHFVGNSNVPLFLAPLSGFSKLLASPLLHIHLGDQKAEGIYSRPFTGSSYLQQLLNIFIPSKSDVEPIIRSKKSSKIPTRKSSKRPASTSNATIANEDGICPSVESVPSVVAQHPQSKAVHEFMDTSEISAWIEELTVAAV